LFLGDNLGELKKVEIVLPISHPSLGAMGKTGIWRVFKPVIDLSKCIKCWQCWLYCPEDAIVKEEDHPKIDYEYCKGCGVCKEVCRVGAIDMVREG